MTETNAVDTDGASPATFEESLAELEALVDRLEREDLTLEESLAAYARGVTLTRACQTALETAEHRIRILTEPSVDAPLEPFSTDD
ncbi:exodeoxyribonuclease VII small subunit [Thioalkalicoccus limnaeus]|uniref:Exodeoxyribonuclease 7 small subunit n=1 Tax=Thioalkalicoccus limnaeus TaxID=120681 RepID=A0ABV4BFE1_9GAMM